MCLIFIKPKNANNYLTYERFSNALTNNPHAVGIVYRDKDGINIERFVKPENYKEEIWNIIKDKEEFAIHFRYATHGILNLTNTHPFIVTNGLCMMHNGVMNEFANLNKEWSDTKNFVEYFLKPYVEKEGIGIINDESFKTDLEKVIGSGNKLLFVDKDFNFSIINEKAGVWKDGCWLSNTYSIEPPYSSYYMKNIPTDGTAGKSEYDYFGYYDQGYFETEDEIYDFIATEIENGYDTGDEVPFYFECEKLDIKDDELIEITSQIRKGITSGNSPCLWELIIDERDFKDLLIDNNKKNYF